MFNGFKAILKLLERGDGADPREIESQIAKLELERTAAIAEANTLGAAANELLRTGADDNELDDLDRAQTKQARIVARIDQTLPQLQGQLAGARAVKRQARVDFYLEKNRLAFETLEKTLLSACAANEAVRAVYEAAAAELGGHDAAKLIQTVHFGGLLLPDAIEMWRNYMRTALDPSRHHRVAATPVVVTKSPAPKPNSHDGIKTGLGSLQHAVRLHEPLPQPPSKQRELRNETAAHGQGLLRCLRDGYETPDGKQCRVGDVVALPIDIARRAAENGAGELVGGEP